MDLRRARQHDMGGQPAGPVDPSTHDPLPWHRLVTGVLNALRDPHRLMTVDEMRRSMEDLSPEDYDRGYFERWAVGLANLAVEKGFMSQAELDQKMTEITARMEKEASK